jgi:hypothetical protein
MLAAEIKDKELNKREKEEEEEINFMYSFHVAVAERKVSF